MQQTLGTCGAADTRHLRCGRRSLVARRWAIPRSQNRDLGHPGSWFVLVQCDVGGEREVGVGETVAEDLFAWGEFKCG